MADGFARATGRPGVCLAVCGPGVLNAATPLATAFTDSVPILLISGQIPRTGLGLRSGYYHENDQLAACATFTKGRARPDSAGQVVSCFDTLWATMTAARPGPALLELPLDVLNEKSESFSGAPGPPAPLRRGPQPPREIREREGRPGRWGRPWLMAGGGVITAGAEGELRQLAERLGAPVFHTAMGKCALPTDHPLAAGLPWHRATSDLRGMEE